MLDGGYVFGLQEFTGGGGRNCLKYLFFIFLQYSFDLLN